MCVLFTSFGSSGSSTKQIAASNGDVAGGKDDTLNIFSLASGHLYERLLRFAASTLQYISILPQIRLRQTSISRESNLNREPRTMHLCHMST